MKKYLGLIIALCLVFTGCSSVKNVSQNDNSSAEVAISKSETVSVLDSTGREVTVKKSPRNVVALSSSFAEIWMLSGGEITGVSSDAFEGRDLGISEDEVEVVGTIKDPSTEKVLAMEPDLVILSGDIKNHINMTKVLDQAQIPYYICKVENLEDYMATLSKFVSITGEEQNYEINGQAVGKKVEELLDILPASRGTEKSALVLRAYSSGVKAKAKDNIVCDILDEIGVGNIARNNNSILEDLSMEAIIEANPDYIFVTTMGNDEKEAIASLNESLASNPAWNNLKAVKNENVIVLPKDLFHYKPNNQWGDAYEYLLKIIYPEIYKTE